MKKSLSTGGTAKGGIVLLQGDQREKTKEELVKIGYPESSIVLY
ncbi:MAG: SUI1 family translation initiation factor [Nitrososphaerales archaeon]